MLTGSDREAGRPPSHLAGSASRRWSQRSSAASTPHQDQGLLSPLSTTLSCLLRRDQNSCSSVLASFGKWDLPGCILHTESTAAAEGSESARLQKSAPLELAWAESAHAIIISAHTWAAGEKATGMGPGKCKVAASTESADRCTRICWKSWRMLCILPKLAITQESHYPTPDSHDTPV